MATAIVVPCNRSISKEFLRPLPKDVPIYVVNDHVEDVIIQSDGHNIIRMREADQDALFKDTRDRDLFFTRRSAGCRNAGILKAYRDGADIIINLDDDVIVPEDFIETHERALKNPWYKKVTSNKKWFNTIGSDDYFARGIPYQDRVGYQGQVLDGKYSEDPVRVHMGMWNNVLDYNGMDKIAVEFTGDVQQYTPFEQNYYGAGSKYIPLCAMNCSARRDSAMSLLQIPMGYQFTHQYKMYRIEDIWGGYIWQTLFPNTVTFGTPAVKHLKKGNLNWEVWSENYANILAKDFEAIIEFFGENIRGITQQDRYNTLGHKLGIMEGLNDPMAGFMGKLSKTLRVWAEAF